MAAKDVAKANVRTELRAGMYTLKTIREYAERGVAAAKLRLWAIDEVAKEYEAARPDVPPEGVGEP